MAEEKQGGSPQARRRTTSKATASDADAPQQGEQTSSSDVRSAFISGNNFRAKSVQYVVVDGDALFEGDIVLGPVDQVEQESEILMAELRGELPLGVIVTGSQFRWPGCRVAYDIDPALPDQARVTNAIAHWEANTNFRFVLRTPANAATLPDWVTFRPGSGCSSSVGKRGGQQFVNLAPGCNLGNTIHEIGHAVGLWHEQSREDRDAFVTINWANIQAGFEHNFNQHITDGDDVGAYDFGSIMHYPRNAFSVGGAETITPRVPTSATIGQRTALSPGDIAAANSMCPTVTAKELSPETIKELSPETVKELSPETIKEQSPETIKERLPETIKELSPETVKERSPETVKEQSPETIKERSPETVKELTPETIKERIPETVKERVETIRENVGPGLPFAMGTAHAGDGSVADDVGARLAAVEELAAALEANQADLVAGQNALAEELAALAQLLGLQ